jgi:D-alanyl-D-alanine carboxypeptidase
VRAILACFSIVLALFAAPAQAAPYAAMVMDARSGEVLHSRNADTRLHPASLTKMMTLYVAFEAVRRGEITLDTKIRISSKAAAEPPSKLGLRAGTSLELRYLIRAAAVRSANDAATAIAEGISGSEAAFAERMNRTARALGMTRTTFKNAHGLTQAGHLSTARDMTLLGRRLLYDYPQYYNLFSRRSTHAGIATVNNTNRRLLDAYSGADGIKTGYTRAAGFNLVASAQRGNERVIATVFGGTSTAARNARVAELLDLGFRRAAPNVAVRKPPPPAWGNAGPGAAGKTLRVVTAVSRSQRPSPRPGPAGEMLLALEQGIDAAVGSVQAAAAVQAAASAAESLAAPKPQARPEELVVAEATPDAPETVGAPSPRPEAEQALVITAGAAPDATADAPPAAVGAAVAEALELVEAQSESASAETAVPAAEARRPADLVMAAIEPPPQAEGEPVVVSRVSSSGNRHWGINVGRYGSRYQAERILLKTALNEMSTLEGSLRRVVRQPTGFDANFMGLSRETADLACRRLQARDVPCFMIGPS